VKHDIFEKIMKYIPGILFAKNDRIKEVLDRS
jgi:hypothetical protein